VTREVHIETIHIITKHVKEVVKTLIVGTSPLSFTWGDGGNGGDFASILVDGKIF